MKLTNILLLICFTASALPGFGQLSIKEGKDAVYVYLSNQRLSAQTPMQSVTGVNIFRAVGNESFKPVGRVQPALTPEDFKRVAGEGILKDIQTLKKLKSEQEAWEYLKKKSNAG